MIGLTRFDSSPTQAFRDFDPCEYGSMDAGVLKIEFWSFERASQRASYNSDIGSIGDVHDAVPQDWLPPWQAD